MSASDLVSGVLDRVIQSQIPTTESVGVSPRTNVWAEDCCLNGDTLYVQ
jgi:hypothetical protein